MGTGTSIDLGRRRRSDTRGMSLIEVLVALTVFSISVLGIARVSLFTSRALTAGKGQMTEWTVAQSTLDSLRGLGWAALAGEKGDAVVQGYDVSWEVLGDNPRQIILEIPREIRGRTVVDTFTTYVANRP